MRACRVTPRTWSWGGAHARPHMPIIILLLPPPPPPLRQQTRGQGVSGFVATPFVSTTSYQSTWNFPCFPPSLFLRSTSLSLTLSSQVPKQLSPLPSLVFPLTQLTPPSLSHSTDSSHMPVFHSLRSTSLPSTLISVTLTTLSTPLAFPFNQLFLQIKVFLSLHSNLI